MNKASYSASDGNGVSFSAYPLIYYYFAAAAWCSEVVDLRKNLLAKGIVFRAFKKKM